jgi:hypothetical protein
VLVWCNKCILFKFLKPSEMQQMLHSNFGSDGATSN